MNKNKFGEWLTIATNLAVVAGIVALAFEVNQNTKQMRAQASFNLLQNRVQIRSGVVENPEIAEFWVRVQSGEPLSAVDARRVQAHAEQAILKWHWEYGQYVDGSLSLSELPVEAFREAYRGDGWGKSPGFPDAWRRMKSQLRPDFVDWMEANVTNQ
jgi:hypothetical protein